MDIPEHIKSFWHEFLNSDACVDGAKPSFQTSYKIGSDEVHANEGANLILAGAKTATSTLAWELEKNAEPVPAVGDLCVIENGKSEAVCVVETTWVEVIPFGKIDGEFARDYAETDGTLEDWKRIFGEYYSAECESLGKVLNEDTPLVCERFRVIYPL